MKKRNFLKNKQALTVMYDAVFFLVMVSLSGAVLIPALNSNVAIDASVEKHREKTVDEALLMLMTARVDDFEYNFAGTQIDVIASSVGIDVNDDDSIYSAITRNFLGKQMVHKTYADLCVENLVSQLQIFDCRVNILTEDYDNALNEEIASLLQEYLKDKYEFNLTIKWRPINGIDFGGETKIGKNPPSCATHVAKSYVSMPNTFFSECLDNLEEYIEFQTDEIDTSINSYVGEDWNETIVKEILWNSLNDTIYGILFDGYTLEGKKCDSVLNTSFDFAFEKVQGSISSIFGNALNRIDDLLKIFGADLSGQLETVIYDNINNYFNFEVKDYDLDGSIGINDLFFGLKKYTNEFAKNLLKDFLNSQLEKFVDSSVQKYSSFSDVGVDDIKTDFSTLLSKHINPLRAEFCLTIWEVRG